MFAWISGMQPDHSEALSVKHRVPSNFIPRVVKLCVVPTRGTEGKPVDQLDEKIAGKTNASSPMAMGMGRLSRSPQYGSTLTLSPRRDIIVQYSAALTFQVSISGWHLPVEKYMHCLCPRLSLGRGPSID